MASSGQTGTHVAQPVQSPSITSIISCYPQSEKPSSPLFERMRAINIQEIIIETIMRVPVDFNPAVS
jgi:hypothetical protein